MNLNLIFEEIKVKDFEGEIEIFKTVKRGEKLETKIEKHHYKLSNDSYDLFWKNCQRIEKRYKYFNRNFFEKYFFKKDINHLLNFISKESEGYSWILSPSFFLESLKNCQTLNDKLIFEYNSSELIFGNFNSATIIRNGEFFQIFQNSPLVRIKIS